MIPRLQHIQRVRHYLSLFQVVGIVGARQVGKTTLARMVASEEERVHQFDLERPADRARLSEPDLALSPLRGLVVLDEIQHVPELFPLLRSLADRPGSPARFLVLGSASPDLLRQGSESLAGRIAWHELGGLSMEEVGSENVGTLWLRGGFPRSYLAPNEEGSADWRRFFVRSFLERDLPQLGITIPSPTLERFWTMLAHYHGQIWNGSELARSFGVSDHTVRRYLDLLTQAFVIRQIQPWHENLGKRQVRSPRVYLSDSGILHTLLDLDTLEAVERHPKVGASWEGFMLRTAAARLGARDDQCYFWSTHQGAELDLLVVTGSTKVGVELKRTTTPRLTRSMQVALEDLKLERLYVVHAGEHTFPLAPRVLAVAAARVLHDIKPL